MTHRSLRTRPFIGRSLQVAVLLFATALIHAEGRPVLAHSDVYTSLPADTVVTSYLTGDVDGDSVEELVVLYRTDGEVRLTLFHAADGRWVRWWDFGRDAAGGKDAALHSFDLVDANRDGSFEVAAYLKPSLKNILITKVLSFAGGESGSPNPTLLLEDFISPPGYPIFGTDNGRASVTFLNMGQGDTMEPDGTGYRRVYCWDSSRFEKCVEVEWEIPDRAP